MQRQMYVHYTPKLCDIASLKSPFILFISIHSYITYKIHLIYHILFQNVFSCINNSYKIHKNNSNIYIYIFRLIIFNLFIHNLSWYVTINKINDIKIQININILQYHLNGYHNLYPIKHQLHHHIKLKIFI